MASSNTIEPWMFRSNLTDSWYPDAFARETESVLTKALQQSFFNQSEPMLQKLDYSNTPASVSTVTGSVSGSGSEPETPGSKRRVSSGTHLGVSAKKRKSRASKKSMTTFIQADPANFRQMVQQVTGVKFEGSGQMPVSNVMKPEPVRQPFFNRLQGLLPTLDTSAYLLDHQNNNNNTHSEAVTTGFSQPQSMYMSNEGSVGNDFYSFSSFPTLESSI